MRDFLSDMRDLKVMDLVAAIFTLWVIYFIVIGANLIQDKLDQGRELHERSGITMQMLEDHEGEE